MKNIIYVLILTTIIACHYFAEAPNPNHNETIETNTITKLKSEVAVREIEKAIFSSRQFIQGKLVARSQADIKTESTGIITQLNVREGGYIEEGQLILSIDDAPLQYDLAQAHHELDDAIFKKRERLVLDGGEPDDDLSVSPDKLKIIHTVSGYNKAHQAIRQIEFQISRTKLYAPFSGRVADVQVFQHEMINAGETIFTLINTGSFECEIAILEDIALTLKKGQQLTLHPLSDASKVVNAKVHIINPIVDDNGLVRVRAKLQSHSYRFFENMNVQVILENRTNNVITIPKEALVIRSGKEVVFTYDKTSSRAKWNYVKVSNENDESLAISDGLSVGDLVIVEGNLNLDHDAEVVVKDSLNIQ